MLLCLDLFLTLMNYFFRGQPTTVGSNPGTDPDSPDGKCSRDNVGDKPQQRLVAQRVVVLRRRSTVNVVPIVERCSGLSVWRRLADADVHDDRQFNAVASGSIF